MAGALALAATGCIKTVFVDATYPAEAPHPALPDPLQALDSALLPALLGAYRDAPTAGACLGQTLAVPAHRAALWRHGQCRAGGGSLTACLGELPWFERAGDRWRLALPCTAPPAGDDGEALAHSLATTGELLVQFEGESLGPRAVALPLSPELDARLGRVADHAARLLGADPRRDREPALPALSLSGGAANGAFIAGFLHALLWLREKGLAHGTFEQKALIERYRFGSTHGTSVGSLVALPLDLYFTDGPPRAEDAKALAACLAGMPRVSGDPRRAYQDCALAHLARDFVKNEWELLCAEPGTVLALMSDDAQNLLRFDPMQRTLIDPFLRRFGPLLSGNAFLRDAVTVDLEHTAVVGLDERACRLPGMPSELCPREAVMASLSEPLFTPPRARVWSGLGGRDGRPGQGERGSWYDGGVGSVNPVTLAVRATRGRVLALDTFRAHGTPAPPARGLGTIAMSMITALGTSLIRWEADDAARLGAQLSAERCELSAALGRDHGDAAAGGLADPRSHAAPTPPASPVGSAGFTESPGSSPHGASSAAPGQPPASAPPEGAGLVSGPAGEGPGCWSDAVPVLRVSVPDDVAPGVLFASGYAFDPVVMRGLFAWGQVAFLRARFQVLGHLGWCALAAQESDHVECPGGQGTSAAQRTIIERLSAEVATEVRRLQQWERPGAWQRHLDHRRALVEARLPTCDR